jgi:hypothetical protein
MKNVTKKYKDEFKHKEDIPVQDLEITELSEASRKVIKYVNKIFENNIRLLKLGFLPETNNILIKEHSTLENGEDSHLWKGQNCCTFEIFIG